MKLRFLLLVALAASQSVHAGVDFTPTTSQRVLAGITFQQLNFRENGLRVTYEQPRGWSYSGGGSRIRFTPPDLTQAHGEIDQTPLRTPQAFDEPTKKALQEQTLAAIPADSQNVEIVSDESDPVLVNNNHTYEVTVAYTAFGQEFMMSIVYLNLKDTQLRFRTLARKSDFEKVHAAFRGSICSWQWEK